MITRIQKIIVKIGHAINANNGRCYLIEDSLIEAQSMALEFEKAIEALRLCVEWMPCAEVRSWPPGFRLRDEAMAAARAAISSVEDK